MTEPRASEKSDAALRARLALLAEEHGQATIARKTGAPRSSVHRYLSGAQIPAWFLVALAEAFALSPQWLLFGTGLPSQASLEPETSGTADRLLELTRAMNAVTKLQVGALTGRDDVRRLRELADVTETAGRLAAKLEELVGARLTELCDRLNAALESGKPDKARSLQREGPLLARFVPASPQAIRFRYLSTIVESLGDNAQRASAEMQQVALLRLATMPHDDRPVWEALISLVTTQRSLGYVDRARRLAEALCAMHPGDPMTEPMAAELRMLQAEALLQEGQLHEARELAHRFAVVATERRNHGVLMNVEYYSGKGDFAAIERMGNWDWTKAYVLALVAIWEEDPVLLVRVADSPQKHWPEWPETGTQFQLSDLMLVAGVLARALDGDLSGLKRHREELTTPRLDDVRRVTHEILLLQVEQAGDRKITLKRLRHLQELLDELNPRIVPHAIEAIFHRAVLRALGTTARTAAEKQLAESSREFFHGSVASGFLRFRPLIS